MKFEDAVEFVLRHEGGLVSDARDTGGLTNYGISIVFFKTEINPFATDIDIVNLTKDEAVEIYREHFWLKYRCNLMFDGLDLLVFDGCVNQGPGAAIKLLQRELGVAADGIVGPVTLKAQMARSDDTSLLLGYFARRAKRYADHPNAQRWARGWYRRLGDVLLMATAQR